MSLSLKKVSEGISLPTNAHRTPWPAKWSHPGDVANVVVVAAGGLRGHIVGTARVVGGRRRRMHPASQNLDCRVSLHDLFLSRNVLSDNEITALVTTAENDLTKKLSHYLDNVNR